MRRGDAARTSRPVERRQVAPAERHHRSPLQSARPHAISAKPAVEAAASNAQHRPGQRQAIVRRTGSHAHFKASGRRAYKFSRITKAMFKIRHIIQSAIVITCLGWGGYQVTSSVLARPEQQPNTTASVVQQQGQTLDATYQGLPSEVAQIVPAIVATQRITSAAGNGAQNGLAGSGVVVGSDTLLTAGHNVQDGKGLACGQMVAVSAGVLSSANAAKNIVTHAGVSYGTDEDLAALTVQEGENFKQLPDVKIAASAPQSGETVYFINYQPTADGKGRTPLAADKAHAEPAIFSATVLGMGDHGLSIAAGGGKSFGLGEPDVMLRKGASGGAVVNAKGELVGLSVSSQSLAADRSASSLLKQYGVDLSAGNYQVVYMQKVSKQLVERLRSGMVSCTASE